MNKYFVFVALLLVFLFNRSMIPSVSSPEVKLETILERYNSMDYEYIVNMYKEGKIPKDYPLFPYLVSVSLFKVSNYQEVLSFTNAKVGFDILDNTIKLLCAFSFSELGDFGKSQDLLKEYSEKPHLSYYDDLVLYYRFRNSIFLEDTQSLVSLNLPSRLTMRDEEAVQVSRLILRYYTNQSLVLSLMKFLQPRMLKGEVLNNIRSSLVVLKPNIEISKELIRLGLTREGYTNLLVLSKREVEKLYYRAMLLYLDRKMNDALSIVNGIKKYYTNDEFASTVNISRDDVEILELNCLSEVLDRSKYNDFVLKKAPSSSKKVLANILSKYKLLLPEVHLVVIKSFLKKTDFSNSDYKYVRSFISYHLNEGNLEIVKKFSDWALGVARGTDWEREFLALKYVFTSSDEEKKNLVLRLVRFYPMTYEYYTILGKVKENVALFNLVTNELIGVYSEIKRSTNFNLEILNSFVGVSLAFKVLDITNTLDDDVKWALSKVSFKFDVYTSTNTNTNTTKFPSYLDRLYSYGLVSDVHLELRKLNSRPDIRYVDVYRRYKAVSMMCRATESYGFASSFYFRRGVFLLYFKDYLYPLPYYDIVSINCSKYDVSLSLAYGVMKSESRYSPFVLSVANAVGLMQLIQPTGSSVGRRFLGFNRDLSLLDIYVVDRNVELGVAHIRELIDFFRNYPEGLKEVLVVSSYNAGTTAVLRWYRALNTSDPLIFVEGIRYLETYNYTKSVIENRWFYDIFVLSSNDNLAYKN